MSGPRGRDQEGLPFDGIAGSEGQEVLSGAVERVTFQNEETGFCVLRVQPRFGRERVAVVGHAPPIKAGEFLRAEGRWVDDPRHGPQFRAESIATQAPVSAEGIERYLGSGLVVGIGPELAKRMVATFGVGVLDVIDETPERLREVPGVGRVRLERIRSAWSAQKRVREIMIFLHGHGIGTVRAARIHRVYGDDAVERIRSDPWTLARDIPGVGFATADALADRLGVSRTALSRARAGVRQIIDDAVRAGDCGLPREDLLRRAEALLGVDTAVVETGLAAEVEARELIAADGTDGPSVFVPALFHAEADAAVRLRAMLRGSPPWAEINSGKAIPWVEAKLGLVLATGQHEALDRALHSRLLVLTGGPGVGKTTLVRALFEILAAKRVRVLLAAPTGRAAKRLAEATAAPASTLHRLLEARPGRTDFGRNPSNPLEVDLLVVDEASMVDVPLLAGLLRALPEEAAVLWIGDPAQLPSVGPGRVLADMIDSGAVPVVALSEIFRQAAQSRIVRAAHRVLAGEMPELASVEGSDFFFLEEEDAEVAAQRIVKLVAERIPGRLGVDAIRDVQVLSPMHRGSLGTKALNRGLQRALNPAGLAGPRVLRFETAFCVGDKVMQMRNDYDRDVFNGDVGFVAGIEPEKQMLRVAFDRGEVEYAFDELDALALAYATTVHKAQGSEYPVVVFPLHGQHTPMLRRNLVYTAMTRGRRLVVIVGQKRSLAAAVRSAPEEKRFTRLALELVPRSRARVPIAAPMPHSRVRCAVLAALLLMPLAGCDGGSDPGAERSRAERIHFDAIVLDAHSDTTPRFEEPGWDFSLRHADGDQDLPRMREGGLDAQFWSIYLGRRDEPGAAMAEARRRIAAVRRLVALHPEELSLATTAQEIHEAVAAGRIASAMGVEGGHIIENDLGNLRELYALGARYLTLTHSFHTDWGDSSGTREDVPARHGGLTPFGFEVVREMNRLGMMVDVSHVSDETFWDVIEGSLAPVIASHSSVRAVADHRRNLDDAMLRALSANGGVLMINFYPAYIDEAAAREAGAYYALWEPQLSAIREGHAEDAAARGAAYRAHFAAHPMPRTSLDQLLDHFDHALAVAGPDHVGIGADWDGVPSMPVGMEDVSKLPALTRGLLARGHSEQTVRKVLGLNLLRVMAEAEAVAARLRAER